MLITGDLENVLLVSVSITGVMVLGADTNSDSLTVSVAAFDVTVVAFGLLKIQRNCSDGVVG